MKFNGRGRRVNLKTPSYGRRRERRWTPTWAEAQDTRASPNSLETHLVRGHLNNYGAEPIEQWMAGWIYDYCSSYFKSIILYLLLSPEFYPTGYVRISRKARGK